MSVVSLDNGWKRFGEGRIWRCRQPDFLCEVDREGFIPDYTHLPDALNKVRKVRAWYAGRIGNPGKLNPRILLDVLTANSFTESYGTVPTVLSYEDLKQKYEQSSGADPGVRLANVVDYILMQSKSLVRKEPGYVNPVRTPGKLSLGAHHALISTALWLQNVSATPGSAAWTEAVKELVFRLPSQSLFAAEMAIEYWNRGYAKHQNEPPLMAAAYNAGSPRVSTSNAWGLVQYGNHIDRWVSYYNTSRRIALESRPVVNGNASVNTASVPAIPITRNLELKLVRKIFTEKSTIGDLYVNEQFYCYTLEDKDRFGAPKIYGETAIPAQRYEIRLVNSQHFGPDWPWLQNVPGYSGVLIHGGNSPADTLGCILVGRKKETDRITESQLALKPLLEQIRTACRRGKAFITIVREGR